MERPSSASSAGTAHRIGRRDWPWLFAYPAYQIIGTIRHEGAHALAVWLEGGRVTKFVFWPTWEGRFYWGYLSWSGRADWLVSAAPYLADLATFAAFFLVCTRLRLRRHRVWVNLYAIGLASPFVNSAYRYASSFFRSGDLTPVMKAVPPAVVHAYFILSLAAYAAALASIQFRRARPPEGGQPPRPAGS